MSPRPRDGHDWLELVERSGLVIGEVPLHRHFPDGPPPLEPGEYRTLLGAWERFRVNPNDGGRRGAWDVAVIHNLLGWPRDRLLTGDALAAELQVRPDDIEEVLTPEAVLADGAGGVLLGLWKVPAGQGLDRVERRPGRWKATPQAKLERWMRGSGVSVALLSNGLRFRLVSVPPGLPAGWIEFETSQWIDERATFASFRMLLAWERLTGRAEPGLSALLAESEKEQTELTDRLGEQVRNAVEDLILALDRADHQASGAVLRGVPEGRLYEAAVFVVMRLVFLLFAEERSLLPHGNVFYDDAYGVGRLLHRLQEERRQAPDTFARECDAWPRLLGLFRLVFYGSGHPDLSLPAYGGDLFDPVGSHAMALLEDPRMRIPNAAVYAVLRSLTLGEARVGRERLAQRFSYRTLDVEHIGYVYEGLLDHRAARAEAEPMVKLRNGTEQAFSMTEMESRGEDALVRYLKDEKVFAGNEDRIRAALLGPSEDDLGSLASLSPETAARCRPFAGVIQVAEVVESGHLYLTTASSRRATGTHYTPIQYTRAMVRETLDPLVYVGEHGKLDEPLRLRSPRELLSLKVGDPAMGSGAFLVQVVRYLGEKLTDTWYAARAEHGEDVPLYLPFAEPGRDREDRVPLPLERDEAEVWARRYVAERCIYGVDKNALAAEMAKLSVWLVTLSRDKPFSFLDHALRSGDSLVGMWNLDQLCRWSLDGTGENQLFAAFTTTAATRATEQRRELEAFPVTDPSDVEAKRRLLAAAEAETEKVRALANLLFGPYLASEVPAERKELLDAALFEATHHLEEPARLHAKAKEMLGGVQPFHWPLEFPEVFESGGFDALVGNPPFMGGQDISGNLSKSYREYLVEHLAGGKRGSADLVAYFLLRMLSLVRADGVVGSLASNTISQGDTREVGLEQAIASGARIISAVKSAPWPGSAQTEVSVLHLFKGPWAGRYSLNGESVGGISPQLLPLSTQWSKPAPLKQSIRCAKGSELGGDYFLLELDEAKELVARLPDSEREFVKPFLNGEDLLQDPRALARRMTIYLGSMSLSEARTAAPTLLESLEARSEGRRARQRWWQYRRPTKALYESVKNTKHVYVTPETSRQWVVVECDADQVFSKSTIVVCTDDEWVFSVVQSGVYEAWKLRWGPTYRNDPRHSISDCFETFPFASVRRVNWEELATIGREYAEMRRRVQAETHLGFTNLYKAVHDPSVRSDPLSALRECQAILDQSVAGSLGLGSLDHDFFPVDDLLGADNVRFTFSPGRRRQILQGLSNLNERQREAAEQSRGVGRGRLRVVHGSERPTPTASGRAQPDTQEDLFAVVLPVRKVAETPGTGSALQGDEGIILGWLNSHPGWHGRAEVTESAGVHQGAWNTAIKKLLEDGLVERTGEKRGTKYRAVAVEEDAE